MRVVTSACERGGVGKTSVTLAMAEVAAAAGVPTLVVDVDPQGNATRRLLGASETDLDEFEFEGPSVLDVLLADGRGTAVDAVTETAASWPEKLYLLPSPGAELTRFERTTTSAQDRRLARGLAGVDRQGIELVLIDTGPSLNLLTQNGMTAADDIVVIAHPLGSRQGVHETVRSTGVIVEEYDVTVAGLVLVDVEPESSRSKAIRDALAMWEAEWGDGVLAHLPSSSIWPTAETEGRPLSSYVDDFGRAAPARRALEATHQLLRRLGVLESQEVRA